MYCSLSCTVHLSEHVWEIVGKAQEQTSLRTNTEQLGGALGLIRIVEEGHSGRQIRRLV